MSSKIQAVIFNIDMWTTDKARKWLKEHDLIPIKRVHKTARFLRYRIMEPTFNHYKTKILDNGIEIVYGFDK